MGTTPYAEPISETMRFVGRQPETVEETRVPINLLEDLALKILYLAGELSLPELGRRMQLHPSVIHEIFEHIRKEQFVEVVGMAGSVHRIVTTSKGQTEAHSIMSRDMYSGPAPVSLSAYVEVIRAQSVMDVVVHRPDLQQGLRESRRQRQHVRSIGRGACLRAIDHPVRSHRNGKDRDRGDPAPDL